MSGWSNEEKNARILLIVRDGRRQCKNLPMCEAGSDGAGNGKF